MRAGLPQLHASASSRVLTDTDAGILATVRTHASGPLVGLYNVTPTPRPFPLHRLVDAGLATPYDAVRRRTTPYDALGGHAVTAGADGVV